MNVNFAPIPFRVLKCCGLWRPLSWTSWKKMTYSGFSLVSLMIVIITALLVLIAVCQMSFNDDLFAENVFLMFALINATSKAANVLLFRGRFIALLNMVANERWSKLWSDEELEIRAKCDKTIRKISVYFTTAVFVAILLRVIAPLVDLFVKGEIRLPVNAYCPCDIRNPSCYWMLYWQQAIGTGIATLIHAAKDCLICAFLLQTCSYLEILKRRIVSIPGLIASERNCGNSGNIQEMEKRLISGCVEDHDNIFLFSKILNSSLEVMLFGQIAVTLPNLCLSIYLLSTQNIASMDFVMTTQFFSAVVIELFFFCWYGNQVTLNSFDVEAAISTMDWTSLTARSQKFLLQMMVRTARPILFRVGPIMDMNIDSFLSIMKTSYSAFSVLQSTKE
ncbi:hypothetical protein TKK_0012116 [Trichogramma kaykai]